ncbi:Uncharacterised protein [Chlamydia trachomatis]|nr:Uncharacterised protein [Chlamydia trachomatis]
MLGKWWNELIALATREVGETAPLSALGEVIASATGEGVAIDVNGIDWVGDGYPNVVAEEVYDIGGVALGSVAYEDLVGG